MTVIEYVLSRLRDIGVTDIFGVPGDFSFPINDAICHSTQVRWIGCCNELNAAYAADGYARVRGVGAVCTTYGVGELSALNGIAGSYAERLPVFHLVGVPNSTTQESRLVMHHTLGNGEYDFFYRMTEPVVCARAIITPQNVVMETERIIAQALYRRRPAYLAFPADLAEQPVLSAARPAYPAPQSNPDSLAAATEAIVSALAEANTACVLPGVLLARTHLAGLMREVIEKAGLPFATMFWDKSVIDEQHPQHMGMYEGALLNEHVRGFVESCDRVLMVGTIMSDFNSGAFTARLDPEKIIRISMHRVHVGKKTFGNIELHDILAALLEKLPKRDWKRIAPAPPDPVAGSGSDPIDAASLYPRWERFLRPNDILMAETGTASMGMGFTRKPAGATFYNQTLWGSIGWATPAAFGAGIAAPHQRVVLITGEGAHQFTVQEISQFARYGLKPVVFVLNNNGYLIERLLCKEPDIAYNDIAPWRYSELPRVFGCDNWFTARATTCAELDAALEGASNAPGGAYVEVVTDPYAASPLALKLHDSFRRLYKA
ncbi:MAG TPA: thiamine pyrophosphate-binding protein [Candidatus Methylacidiphilales bacterium]|jgi:indolepyruvate decarboxylase|nr:thiamine pyrophosphate-binding protein [Candidatus Methylacidiphilales bacterium]